MNQIELQSRLNRLLSCLEENDTVQSLIKAKKELYHDQKLAQLLFEYHQHQQNPYSKEYRDLRKELFAHPVFQSYQSCENELSYLILAMNQQLEQLTKGE